MNSTGTEQARGAVVWSRRRKPVHSGLENAEPNTALLGSICCYQSAVTMRLCAWQTSAKLTPFPRSSTTGWTTDGKYLFGAEFSFHGKKITPNRLRGWSILNSFGNYCIGGSPSQSH